MTTIIGGQHIKKDKTENNGRIAIQNGKFVNFKDQEKTERKIKLKETDLVFPGFIDLHVHGGGGADVMEDNEEALKQIAIHLAKHGVTGWVATTYTAPIVDMADVGAAASWLLGTKDVGAEILGVNHEGPFISRDQRGAHPENGLLLPDSSQLEELIAPAAVCMVTLAPELPGALKLIDQLKERNIVASIGHTNGSYDQIKEAIERGATHVVHCFNSMAEFHHRSPGALGAILTNEGVTCEVIADLVHVHPAAIKLLVMAKGPEKVALVSDAIAAAGLGNGEYEFAGQHAHVKDFAVTLESGSLAGSVLTLDRAVKNMVEVVDVSLIAVAKMASLAPATILKLEKQKGQITEGFDADLTILDKDYNVLYTIVGGHIVYQREIPSSDQSEENLQKEAEKEFEKFLNADLDNQGGEKGSSKSK